ncbi:MAG: hypothetical protein CM1200mP14_26630 [Gammaproteobacteria bacterium]|nr:MAG: hypothetical protein CM1200mP14_26630 [Gammaproteobacteria bacterium]
MVRLWGQDSIDAGRIAGMLGIGLVMLVMMAYYRVAGTLAVGLWGVRNSCLGGLQVWCSLTVPGIAGLILSIGMAVDANVLIFERIREELSAGRATRPAVEKGFFSTHFPPSWMRNDHVDHGPDPFPIRDGPVRGFAVTLSIGIVASFFSALFVTRSFFLVYLRGRKRLTRLASKERRCDSFTMRLQIHSSST